MKERLLSIAAAEECTPDEMNLVDDILEQAQGDMRRAVTTLQSVHSLAVGAAAALSTGSGAGVVIDKQVIAEIAGLPPSSVIDKLWTALSSNSDFNKMQDSVEEVCASGYSAQFLLSALLPKVMADETLTELGKAQLAIRMAEAEKNMIEGADELLQLLTVCSLALSCFAESQKPSN